MARKDLDRWLWMVGNELQRLGEEMNSSSPAVARHIGWEPRIDVVESADHILIRAEIAGCRTEDIRLIYEPEEHTLVLRGVRREEEPDARYRAVHQLEIFYGEFAREIRLPGGEFNVEEMTAQYHNGFLTIVVPRADERPTIVIRRTISINRV